MLTWVYRPQAFGERSYSPVRTLDADVEWGEVSILYQLFTEGFLRGGHCAPRCGCAEPKRGDGLLLPRVGVGKCATVCQVITQGRRQMVNLCCSQVTGFQSPPSSGASMAMRTWAGEGEGRRSQPLVCLVLSSLVSPPALPLFVSNGTLERASPGPFQCPTEFQAPLRSVWCFQC